MLRCDEIFGAFRAAGIELFTGVPDSLLKDFCAYATDHADPALHIITPNEGNAVALAAGHYFATNQPGLVYLQNSGLGNTINPLLSLADPEVYAVPMIVLVGWRGEPGRKDEPQHIVQGRVTLPTLEAIGVHAAVLPDEPREAAAAIETAVQTAVQTSAPYALVVRKGTFEPYALQTTDENPYSMVREDAVKLLVEHLDRADVVVSTTGKTSRELFEYRVARGEPSRDFLTVGSMGHASHIALGVALGAPDRRVWCFDGDGSVLMHMGALAVIGERAPANLVHVVINNGAHDSVGGQPTVGFDIDLPAIARGCGYSHVARADSADALCASLAELANRAGPWLLEVRTNRGARSDLGRPTSTPLENKLAFMRHVQSGS